MKARASSVLCTKLNCHISERGSPQLGKAFACCLRPFLTDPATIREALFEFVVFLLSIRINIIDKYWIVLISILYFFYLLLIMSWVLGQNHSRSMDQGGRFPQLNMNEDLLNFSCGTWILHTTHLPGKFGWTSSGFPWAVGAGGAVLEIPLVCCWWNLMTHLKPAVPMFFCTQTLWSEHLAHSQSVAWVLCRIQWK